MVQCEMCGAETGAPKTVKIEGAELQVCADCADFGTEVTQQSSSSTSTKYSTGSSGSGSTSRSSAGGGQSSSSRRSRHDMFDEMEEIATDYDERIRHARESEGLTQAELADDINEKVSLVRKLENGTMRPSDEVQRKLEHRLDISLTAGEIEADEEWESSGGSTGLTLGDMVKRKD